MSLWELVDRYPVGSLIVLLFGLSCIVDVVRLLVKQ